MPVTRRKKYPRLAGNKKARQLMTGAPAVISGLLVRDQYKNGPGGNGCCCTAGINATPAADRLFYV
jgi:hypothetical protein